MITLERARAIVSADPKATPAVRWCVPRGSGGDSEVHTGALLGLVEPESPAGPQARLLDQATGSQWVWLLSDLDEVQIVEVPSLERRRLDLAVRALTGSGGFEPHEVDDDVAPRITEIMSAWHEVVVACGLVGEDETVTPWELGAGTGASPDTRAGRFGRERHGPYAESDRHPYIEHPSAPVGATSGKLRRWVAPEVLDGVAIERDAALAESARVRAALWTLLLALAGPDGYAAAYGWLEALLADVDSG